MDLLTALVVMALFLTITNHFISEKMWEDPTAIKLQYMNYLFASIFMLIFVYSAIFLVGFVIPVISVFLI